MRQVERVVDPSFERVLEGARPCPFCGNVFVMCRGFRITTSSSPGTWFAKASCEVCSSAGPTVMGAADDELGRHRLFKQVEEAWNSRE